MTDLINAEHIGTYYVRADFDSAMYADVNLRDPTNYTIPGATVLTVTLPTAQNQSPAGPFVLGGSPKSVYLLCDVDLNSLAASLQLTINNAPGGPTDQVTGANLVVNQYTFNTVETKTDIYWEYDGLRLSETKKEIGKTGARFKSKTLHKNNYGLVHMTGKVADIVSGGAIAKLQTDIDGPLTGIDALPIEGLTPGGFSPPGTPTPGIGDTISLNNIPAHVDKLWGPCDGSNTVFRSSIFFIPHTCLILYVPPSGSTEQGYFVDSTDWFSPMGGKDRLIRLTFTPSEGASLLAIYIPIKSLLRIDQEIIAYDNADHINNTVEIIGRDQLSTQMQAHLSGTTVEDVWMASFIGRAAYNLLCWGASGTALEIRANDAGISRTDNQFLTDTDMRRAVFNTSVNMRGTPGTFDQAMRYIYPNLWPHIEYSEDYRWPGCITIWYSEEVIGDTSWIEEPQIEPWENWINHIAWIDGIDQELLYETYFRDPIGDITYSGDYYQANGTSNPDFEPYPIIVGGVPITVLGTPAPIIPPPYITSYDYRRYIQRPIGLERALPCGIGILILDRGYLS